jgi:hypothetical protein
MRQASRVRRNIHAAVITTFLLTFGVLLLLSQFGPHDWQVVINAGCCVAWIAIALFSLVRRDRSYLIVNHLLLATWFLVETLRLAWPGSMFSYAPWSNALSLAGILALVALAVNIARHLPGTEQQARDSRSVHLAPFFSE